MNQLTVRDLRDIISRSESVIVENYEAEEHMDLIRELRDVQRLIDVVVGQSGQGCALDAVIIDANDDPTSDDATMATLVELINQADASREASFEFPGAIHMRSKVGETLWVIGNVNGPWGADLNTDDGSGTVDGYCLEVEGSEDWTAARLHDPLMAMIVKAEARYEAQLDAEIAAEGGDQ